MYNGSLDADAMAQLAAFKDRVEDVDVCNEAVEVLAQWLESLMQWPLFFGFKGKRLEANEENFAFMARYYVSIARTERKLLLWQEEPLAKLLRIDDFWKVEERENDEYLELKDMFDAFDADDYVDGADAFALLHNYICSVTKLVQLKTFMPTEIRPYPPFLTYESELKAYLETCAKSLEEAKTNVAQRFKVLEVRLRYDSIQREMESLETL